MRRAGPRTRGPRTPRERGCPFNLPGSHVTRQVSFAPIDVLQLHYTGWPMISCARARRSDRTTHPIADVRIRSAREASRRIVRVQILPRRSAGENSFDLTKVYTRPIF